MIDVAVGIIHNLKRPEQILLSRRQAHQDFAGFWEFAGGKFEPGESFAKALERELQEELGIQVVTANPWFCIQHTYPHKTVRLHIANVMDYRGEPASLEQQEIAWVGKQDLPNWQVPEANESIIRALLGKPRQDRKKQF